MQQLELGIEYTTKRGSKFTVKEWTTSGNADCSDLWYRTRKGGLFCGQEYNPNYEEHTDFGCEPIQEESTAQQLDLF